MKQQHAIPFDPQTAGGYLYLSGGSHSSGKGCPDWGSNDPAELCFIGDRLGTLVLQYADGSSGRVPLVLGYTLWLRCIRYELCAPFFGEGRDEELAQGMQRSLQLFGAWEGAEEWLLRIALPKPLAGVSVEPAEEKNGTPVFDKAYCAGEPADEAQRVFFVAHTVMPDAPVPAFVSAALDAVCHALHTFESDFEAAPEEFVFPQPPQGFQPVFSGTRLAAVATGSVYHNMKDLGSRTDADGFLHTSYPDAPSWWYDGFGPYVPRVGSYTANFYSRDAGRAIMTLAAYGYGDAAAAACGFGNRWMMYYREQGLQLAGVPIPGHYSVMPNTPLIYSQVLTKLAKPALADDPDGSQLSAWPTRYTFERFGEGHGNVGNPETDGHGLMMMANRAAWRAQGADPDYVRKNWTYINEMAEWILWSYAHPELSFVENDLLYGETEAAMNDYTLYTNVPCYLGLLSLAEMAQAAGEEAAAESWRQTAGRLRRAIDAHLTDGQGWKAEKFGFHHDPVLTMLADVYGYDTADMPADWVARSRASYETDRLNAAQHGWYGPKGIGYDHAMITQNALLLDRMADADGLLNSLCKLSYAPRLPEPYLIPEALSVDAAKGVLRRQGDLGNLVQQAEAMKCWLLAVGVSPLREGTVKVMPRLPAGWSVKVQAAPVPASGLCAALQVSAVRENAQSIELHFAGEGDARLQVRFGPFDAKYDTAQVKLNGEARILPLQQSGDSKWAWLELPALPRQ